MGPIEVCRVTASAESVPSGNSDSNDQVHELQYSIERQYLKDFLQYIRGLMRDWLEVIRDLESRTTTTTNNDDDDDAGGEIAQSNPKMAPPFDVQHDEIMLQQDKGGSFADAEHFKPAAVPAHQTINRKQPSTAPGHQRQF